VCQIFIDFRGCHADGGFICHIYPDENGRLRVVPDQQRQSLPRTSSRAPRYTVKPAQASPLTIAFSIPLLAPIDVLTPLKGQQVFVDLVLARGGEAVWPS